MLELKMEILLFKNMCYRTWKMKLFSLYMVFKKFQNVKSTTMEGYYLIILMVFVIMGDHLSNYVQRFPVLWSPNFGFSIKGQFSIILSFSSPKINI
jgi:hypothetical protein